MTYSHYATGTNRPDGSGACGNCRHPYYLHYRRYPHHSELGGCWHRWDGQLCGCEQFRQETEEEKAQRIAARKQEVAARRRETEAEQGELL